MKVIIYNHTTKQCLRLVRGKKTTDKQWDFFLDNVRQLGFTTMMIDEEETYLMMMGGFKGIEVPAYAEIETVEIVP